MIPSEYHWIFGELIGPLPVFVPEKPEGCELACKYRQKSTGEERLVHFIVSKESRVQLNDFATADGVDWLLRELMKIKQFNLQEQRWDPKDVLIFFSELEQLRNARERAMREAQGVPDYGEL
jgi:hypothetical protein